MVSLSLGACESLNDIKGTEKSNIEVVNNEEVRTKGTQATTSINDQELKNLSTKFSGGSVEIFDVDGDGQIATPSSTIQQDYIGIPAANDPRVVVYPLDGDTGVYSAPIGQPQFQNKNGVGGYGYNQGMAITSAPVDGWVDEGMDVAGGVLSPRVGQNISSVYFGYGSSKLNSESKHALISVAQTAKFAPVERVSIEGHASRKTQTSDPIKSKILNLKESMNRAQSVTQNLIENGVPAEKIKTTAWGDTKPTSGGDSANRRVDIVTGFGAQ